MQLIITDNHLLNVLKVESFQVEQDLIKINKIVEKTMYVNLSCLGSVKRNHKQANKILFYNV